jgi:hypothetical protein
MGARPRGIQKLNMSRVIGQWDFTRKPALRPGRRFDAPSLAAFLGLLILAAYPQTAFAVAPQEPAPGEKAQIDYVSHAEPHAESHAQMDDTRLPDLSSLNIPILIRDSDRLGAAMHLRLPEYTYIQTRISRELDQSSKLAGKPGKLVERVSAYEAYPIEVLGHQRHIISLVSEDGAPVSPKRLIKERRQAAKEMEAAELEGASQSNNASTIGAEKYVTAGIGVSLAGDGVWIGVSQFLRQCQFGKPRYDRLAGREMIALSIHSCACDASDPRERYIASMAGIVWIDASDKVVARLEAWPRLAAPETEIPSTSKDAETIVYEQMRLPNSLWVPKRIRLNAIGKAALFNGTDKDMTFEFSHYQRFNTEVKDLQQMTLKSKP